MPSENGFSPDQSGSGFTDAPSSGKTGCEPAVTRTQGLATTGDGVIWEYWGWLPSAIGTTV